MFNQLLIVLIFYLSLINFKFFFVNAQENVKSKSKPHIVLILADDLGFDDVSFRGSNEFLTPNIDALAYHGRILDRFYAPPICTPSRAALLTGLYPIYTGTQILTHLNGLTKSLSKNITLMPELFKNAGYSTNLIGKWNLGHARKEDTPTYRGFDHHYGYWGSNIDHFTRRSSLPLCNLSIGFDFRRDMAVDCERIGSYVTELFTEEAEEVISRHASTKPAKSLFLMIAHAVPHAPLLAPPEEVEKFAYIKNPARRTYAAMLSILDRSVGRVIRALERAEMLENSIIIFSSDNGGTSVGHFDNSAGSNWPLRGQKDSPWEGGVRLAAAIWSPLLGATRQSAFRKPIYIADWLPTLAQAASIELPRTLKLNGLNMWESLREVSMKEFISERSILHMFDTKRHVVSYMRGVWKYLNGTTNHQYDNVITLREHDEIDPRARRYVVEVRNSVTSKALSKFDHQRLTQNRIQTLRRGARVQCGELQHGCNPLVEECLFNIELDPCEQNNLIYERKLRDTLQELREEVQKLGNSAVAASVRPNFSCKLKDSSDPAFHNCLWTNYLDEPVSSVSQHCTDSGTPCVQK